MTALRALVNGTVLGVAMQFANGIPINIRATGELNNDGIASDRPSGVPRNSLNLPARYNVDLRLSRQVAARRRDEGGSDCRVEERVQHRAGQRRLGNVVRRQQRLASPRRRCRRAATRSRRAAGTNSDSFSSGSSSSSERTTDRRSLAFRARSACCRVRASGPPSGAGLSPATTSTAHERRRVLPSGGYEQRQLQWALRSYSIPVTPCAEFIRLFAVVLAFITVRERSIACSRWRRCAASRRSS